MRLRDKTAIVTGASRGIGRSIALAFAAEGARLALVARSGDELADVAAAIENGGGRALPLVADLCDPGQVAELPALVESALGPPDVLVNNAGIAGPTSVLWEVEPEDWDRILRTNLTSVYLCCRAFLPGMVSRASGNVVIIGSATGKRPLHGRAAYAASKLGLVGLVRTLAWETGTCGIRVNLISPGAVEGPRLDRVLQAQARAQGRTREQAATAISADAALRRFVTAEDVAAAAVFLASNEAKSVTGEDFNVSAGLTMF